jgi:hypothetical protein
MSKALHGAEEQYPRIEKLAFALVTHAWRIRPYFQVHTIKVLTEYPLRKILQKPNLSGQLVNWAIKLEEFDKEFHLRTSLKGRALADFLAEFCNFLETPQEETQVASVHGSSTQKYSRGGVVLKGPGGEEIEAAIQLKFTTTNNEAMYKAIIARMNMA